MDRLTEYLKKYGFILGYLALTALLAGAIRYFVWHQMDDWTTGLLVGAPVLGALFVLANPAQVRAALTRRGTRYGSNAVLMSVAFVAIIVGLNYLAGRYHYRYDATELKEHTLSPQSVQVLEEIDRPVAITGFFPANDFRRQEYDKLLNQYLDRSALLSYTTIDPDREPVKAQQYENPPYGGLLLESGQRTEAVHTPDEQSVTNALLKVVSDETKVIYFLTGHQERDIAGYGEESYSTVADALRDQNYEVSALNLAITETVPSDAAVVIIAAPQSTLLEDEVGRMGAYLLQGGKALIMQDPANDAGLNDLLIAWQVRFGAGLAIDLPSSLMTGPAAPVVDRYRFSQITKDMGGLMSFFPLARPVEQFGQDPTGQTTFTPLAETSSDSWAEQDMETAEVEFNEGADVPGPLTLAASLEAPALVGSGDPNLKTRLVLVGDSDFASNGFVENRGNSVLFMNAVNWLTEEESMIAIGPKGSQPRQVFLSGVQSSGIFFISVILIPFALLVAGVVVWWQRR
ncbi:MAG: Gldg family protein [Chloroflexota bacterium]|nr:Gldg family protein [Chloroflexota bacterium]